MTHTGANKRNKLYIPVGPAASGKSTWTSNLINSEPKTVSISRDSIRKSCFGRYTDVDESLITKLEHNGIRASLRAGYDVVVDATNLNQQFRNKIIDIGLQENAEIIINDSFCDGPLSELLERNSNREKHVPSEVVRRHYRAAQRERKYPVLDIAVHQADKAEGKEKAYLVDIDGTVATMVDRTPYEYHKAHADALIEDVANVIKTLGQNHTIIYVSGRDDICYNLTKTWIKSKGLPDGKLLMRKNKDQRSDWIVKNEIFQNHINGKYNIVGVFDDRRQVTLLYKRLGLKVFNVSGLDEGDF